MLDKSSHSGCAIGWVLSAQSSTYCGHYSPFPVLAVYKQLTGTPGSSKVNGFMSTLIGPVLSPTADKVRMVSLLLGFTSTMGRTFPQWPFEMLKAGRVDAVLDFAVIHDHAVRARGAPTQHPPREPIPSERVREEEVRGKHKARHADA